MVKWRPAELTDTLLAVDVKGSIRRYSAKQKKQVDVLDTEEGEDNRIFALDYANDGKTFATGGTDHYVRVYDDEKMKLINKMDPFYTK